MRKGKILNILIVILTMLVILSGTSMAYLFFTRETYTVTFNLNGADSVDAQSLECTSYLNGCTITIPNVTRNNGKAVGFSYGTSDTIARFVPGDQLLVSDDMNLYAVSYSENTLKIDTSSIDFVEQNEVKCGYYNNDKSCKVALPRFNKIGYVNVGYSTTSKNTSGKIDVEYIAPLEYTITSDVTLYPKPGLYKSTKAYSTNYKGLVYGNFVEADKIASDSIVNKYKKYLEEINAKAPYLLVNIKYNLLSESQFDQYWGDGESTGILGVTYNANQTGPTKHEVIDIKYNYSGYSGAEAVNEYYHVFVHEIAHSWDSYYPYGLKRMKPDTINSSNEKNHESSEYYKDYYDSRISQHQDIVDLYDKYKAMPEAQRPISDYAYTKRSEFFAEAMSFYYLKYIVPTGKYANISYPEELKKVIEKYICVATHDYHNKGCY